MRDGQGTARRAGSGAVLAGWLILSLGGLGLALSGTGAPGLYYDEAWFGLEARRFLEPAREAALPPGARSLALAGRPFPLFSAPYLGALKSQTLIPALVLFGPRVETLRLATLATALVALLATLLAARRVFDAPTALLSGALLAADPSVFFHAQWEWAPFTTGWLCRAAGAALLLRSAQEGGAAAAGAGALLLGASVYNRIDSALVLLALALALLVCQARELGALARARRRELTAALAGGALGSLPMLLNLPQVWGSFEALGERGDFGERLRTLLTTLDGSYVHRLMVQGGRFDALDEASAPATLLGVVCLGVLLVVAARSGRAPRGAQAVLALACALLTAALLALRGATRAHHMLDLAPLVHVLVASGLVSWARAGRRHALVAAGVALAILASDVRAIHATRELVARTGGRGWWSDALGAFARELEAEPGAVAVSLDWGFHLPLLFQTTKPRALEPIWYIPGALRRRGAWSFEGTPAHHYLVHAPRWDRFGLSADFLRAARAAGAQAEIRSWRDGEGEVVFHVVRVRAPHRWTLARGRRFRLELEAGATPGPAER